MKNTNRHMNGRCGGGGGGGGLNGMSKSTLALTTVANATATATTTGPKGYTGLQRKTSAEIVSEARSMLAGVANGARLVSTRRPITPREPRRQLYGKQAPPGRPPSSFSLRYLQFESRSLSSIPSLDPIVAAASKNAQLQCNNTSLIKFLRTASVDSLSESSGPPDPNGSTAPAAAIAGKLPALLTPPKMTGSFDNLSEEMPPRMDFKPNRNENSSTATQAADGSQPQHSSAPPTADASAVKKPRAALMRASQRPSLDENHNQRSPAAAASSVPAGKAFTAAKLSSSSSSSSQQRKTLVRNNELLAQSSTETLLDLLKAHAGLKECSEETATHINSILTELYTRVKGARGDWRGAVLGALYGLVECTAPKILISVARVVLVLCVTGSNLTGACKLVFKVARSEINDMLFVDSDVPELLIDGLGRASPLDEPEACIYGYGAVRFLANASISAAKEPPSTANVSTSTVSTSASRGSRQKTIAYRLARHGAVQLMVLHLQMLNEAGANVKLSGPPLHAMFQLSGALRVLAKTPSLCQLPALSNPTPPPSLFSSTASHNQRSGGSLKQPQIQELYEDPQDIQLHLACVPLVRAAEICIGDTEVQTNIIRTLSALSELPASARTLADCSGRLGMLLGPIDSTKSAAASPLVLLVRLGYVLGNVMAAEDAARLQFFNNDVAMEYLLQALEFYGTQPNYSKSTAAAADSVLDVLVKLVRVVANMSVNEEVGWGLGDRPQLGAILLRLLLAANGQDTKSGIGTDMEELRLATLGALHNLSFYQSSNDAQDEAPKSATSGRRQPASSVAGRLADLSAAMCRTLQCGSLAARIEAARVLGNMTRSPVARDALCAAGGLRVLVRNLESVGQQAVDVANDEASELIATSCGVLVNLLSDWERRAPFRELRGPFQLRAVLQRAAVQEDWPLAGTVCQALWNFLIDTANIVGALGEAEADLIAADLAEYLDEEGLFGVNGPVDERWEHFAVVAADLLERIQAAVHYSVSPCASSSEEEEEEDDDDGEEEVDGGDLANGADIFVKGREESGDAYSRGGKTAALIGNGWQGQHFRTWLQED